jgi:GNAT superfamily N-acetyltransferase
MVFTRGRYRITTDRSQLDLAVIHDFLSRDSYWASGRTLATVRHAVEHSLCFGLFEDESQVGFCRVVTDEATFAWLCDVFVLPSHRGLGLGKWMIECVRHIRRSGTFAWHSLRPGMPTGCTSAMADSPISKSQDGGWRAGTGPRPRPSVAQRDQNGCRPTHPRRVPVSRELTLRLPVVHAASAHP